MMLLKKFILLIAFFTFSCNSKKEANLVQPVISVIGNEVIVVENYPDPDYPDRQTKYDFKKLNELIYNELISGRFRKNEVYLIAPIEYTNSFGYKDTYKLRSKWPYLVEAAKKYKDFSYWNNDAWGQHCYFLERF